MTDKPRRRVQVRIEIGADSWRDAISALRQYEYEISVAEHRGQRVVSSTSGGYAWGGTIEADEDPSITHDSYFEALDEYLGRKREVG